MYKYYLKGAHPKYETSITGGSAPLDEALRQIAKGYVQSSRRLPRASGKSTKSRDYLPEYLVVTILLMVNTIDTENT